MATAEEYLAAAAKAEKAGALEDAQHLRDLAAKSSPQQTVRTRADYVAAADKARAAGAQADADHIMQLADKQFPPQETAVQSTDPRAIALAAFESANPGSKGDYTPENFPYMAEYGQSAPVTAPPMQPAGGFKASAPAPDTFGDTTANMMAGPWDAAKSFAGGLAGGPSPSRDFFAQDPLTKGLPSPVLTGLGGVGDAGMAALSGIGTAFSGAVGLGAEMVPGLSQKTEQDLAGGALFASQFAAPELFGVSSASLGLGGKVAGSATKVQKVAKEATPTIESLRTAKSAAYKSVDDAGEKFSASEMGDLRNTVEQSLAEGNYVEGVDRQTDAVRSILERKATSEMSLGQVDKLRQEFYKRLSAAPNEVGIHDAIDAIDEMIAARPDASGVMAQARAANSQYKKAELLDTAFERAKNQTSATGSGGNILNKYRQAVVSIVNNPKQAKWFSNNEIDTMKKFIAGSKTQNAMRLVGKLSPGGNGLMTAINLLGAGATGGSSIALSGLAIGAKALSDTSAIRGADRLIGKVAKGAEPIVNAGPAAPAMSKLPLMTGPAVSAAANSAQEPDYFSLYGRY